MNWKQGIAIIVGIATAVIFGWNASPKTSEVLPKAAKDWPFEFGNTSTVDTKSAEKALLRRGEALNLGFLMPKNPQLANARNAVTSQVDRSETGYEIPPQPRFFGGAYKNGKLLLYVFEQHDEEEKFVGYGIGDMLESGWVIQAADLNEVDLKFDNVGLTVNVLSAQTK